MNTEEPTNVHPIKPDLDIEPQQADSEERPADELRAAVREAMAREGLNKKEVAAKVEYSRAAFSKWLDGKYETVDKDLETAIQQWLATIPAVNGEDFVETPSSEKILSVLCYAQANADMALVFGGPGTGKTSSLRQFIQTYPERSWMATITPASAGLVSALETVASAVGLGSVQGGARRISAAIRERLTEERGCILLIDEAQHLSVAAIEELRSIHDAAECGLVFVGNETSYARLTGNRAANFAQVYSRIGARLEVSRPDAKDVEAVCDAWRVRDAQARAFLCRLAAKPGALRVVTKVLRLITRSGNPVNASTLGSACRMLGAEL